MTEQFVQMNSELALNMEYDYNYDHTNIGSNLLLYSIKDILEFVH